MRKRFLRNRRNFNKQDLPPPKSPVDGRAKSFGFDINEPPNLKRRPNFSVLSSAGSEDIKQNVSMHQSSDESQSHKTDCDDFSTASAYLQLGNNNSHNDDQVFIDENDTLPSMSSSPKEPDYHTLNLSLSISGKTLPALDKFLNKIMRDLDRYQEEDDSILSTKCVLDSNPSDNNFSNDAEARRGNILHEMEESGLTNDSNLISLSTPSSSFIDDFRKAVDSLQNDTSKDL